jgi:hypothetical protein
MVALGLLLGIAGLLWVIVIDTSQADHMTKNKRSHNLDVPVAEAIRRAGRRYSQSGTEVLNQKTLFQRLHGFYTIFTSCALL